MEGGREMITTKKARKVLTKKEQEHLKKSRINSMAKIQSQFDWMKKTNSKDPWRICPDCFRIAGKLGIK